MSSSFFEILQPIVHYSFHFLIPGLIAWKFYPSDWKRVWLVFVLTMLVDLDHLLATPIFEPERCSIGFHPLHSYWAIGIYFGMVFVRNKWVRVVAVGILVHMFTDFQDCIWNKLLH